MVSCKYKIPDEHLGEYRRKSKAKVAERTTELEQAMERLQGLGPMQAKAEMLASVSDGLLRTSRGSEEPEGERNIFREFKMGY
jgi:hypothetical protein